MPFYTEPPINTGSIQEDTELMQHLYEREKQAETNLIIFSICIFIMLILCIKFKNEILNFFKTRKIQRIGFILFTISIIMTVISVKGEGMINVLAIFGGVVLAVIILWVAKASIERTRMCNVMESTIRNMWMQTGAVTPEQQDRIAIELMSGPFFSVQNLKQYRTALAVLNIMSGDIVKDKEKLRMFKLEFLQFGQEHGWTKDSDFNGI